MKPAHQQPGIPAKLYQPLSTADIKTIADAAMRILEKSGMHVYSNRAREALSAAGAELQSDGVSMRMPRAMVEDAIASNPSDITLYSRDGQTDCRLQDHRVHYGTGGTAIYVIDPETGERRPSETRDIVLNARMVEKLNNIHLFTINVFPNEIKDTNNIDVNRFFHALDHTHKHVMGGIYSLSGCKEVVEMAEMIAGSPAALREKPFVSFITLIISPFKIDDHYGEMTCYLAEQGLPLVVPTEPICGTSAPVTLAGNILTHIAETLGGITLVQAVNKGAPGICGSVGSITNLQTMDHVGGAIERAMINSAVAQMAQHFEIPLYSTAGTTDSKQVDIQAAYESAMSSLLVAMSGANYIHDIAGLMEADLTVSYDKLVMDNEILGMCQRVLRGIEVTDETLATDLIIEQGPGTDFMATRHTVEHMRGEFYMPEISDRTKRGTAMEAPSAIVAARQRFDAIRNEPVKSLLPDDVRNRIIKRFDKLKQL